MMPRNLVIGGNRSEWEFEYVARELADGARKQKAYRDGRVKWWQEQKDQVMAEIRSSGIDVVESVTAGKFDYASNSMGAAQPTITVKPELQKKLQECHTKIQQHQEAAVEYDGWIQVLEAKPDNVLKLTNADWLYFFGKI